GEWAAAIGPARGSCLPSMAGQHVLDVADLLVDAAETAAGRPAPEPRPKAVRPTPDALRPVPDAVVLPTPDAL
ncbi:ADP-ribosylglycohydrolase family protein, partial [Streptomyces sp. SID10815]|nr:ADP-ribosylglycohydrolase family protein [Streptomyces sp. SID10815]